MNESETALTRDETYALLLERLKEASAAHGVHEATVLEGKFDEEWPEWYTDHMVKALAQAGYRIIGPRL